MDGGIIAGCQASFALAEDGMRSSILQTAFAMVGTVVASYTAFSRLALLVAVGQVGPLGCFPSSADGRLTTGLLALLRPLHRPGWRRSRRRMHV